MKIRECRGTGRPPGHAYVPDGHVCTGQRMVKKIVTKMYSHFVFYTNSYPRSLQVANDDLIWKCGRGSEGKWRFKPRQVVQFDGRSSTSELLTYFCYIFNLVGVVTFAICFFLQEKYKEEVVKKYGKDFNYEVESIDDRVIYDSWGGKAHGRWDRCIVFFNFVNMRYDTSYYCWLLFLEGLLYSMGCWTIGSQCRRGEVHCPRLLVLCLVYLRYT
jgi:hypothetical protein